MPWQVTYISAVRAAQPVKNWGIFTRAKWSKKTEEAEERWTPLWQHSFLCQIIVGDNKKHASQVTHSYTTLPLDASGLKKGCVYIELCWEKSLTTHVKMGILSSESCALPRLPPPFLPPSVCTCEGPAGWKLSQGPDALCQHWDSRKEAGLYSELHTQPAPTKTRSQERTTCST